MKSKSILPLACIAAMCAAFSAHAETGYAESIYADYSKAAHNMITFSVATLSHGSADPFVDSSFYTFTDKPWYVVVSNVENLNLIDPTFTDPGEYQPDGLYEKLSAFTDQGLPISQANVRELRVRVTIGKDSREHRAVELCWTEQDYCHLYDPSVDYVQTIVRDIRKAKADGWYPKITLSSKASTDVQSKATSDYCRVVGFNTGTVRVGKSWPALTVGKVKLGAANSGLECVYENSICKINGYASADTSTFSGLSIYQSGDCDKLTYLYPNTNNVNGTVVAETATGCTIRNATGARLTWYIKGTALSGDISYTAVGTITSQGNRYQNSCTKI